MAKANVEFRSHLESVHFNFYLFIVMMLTMTACTRFPSDNALVGRSSTWESLTTADVRWLFPNAHSCESIPCLLASTYAQDSGAAALAQALWTETGCVAGVGNKDSDMSITRGSAHLVPELPIGRYVGALERSRKALVWINSVVDNITEKHVGPPLASRWRDFGIAFLRSTDGYRPSGWVEGAGAAPTINLNVVGSLTKTELGMRDLIVHEIFHWNDIKHGRWSETNIAPAYASIIARCENDTACLAPYTPTTMMLRDKMGVQRYYAFDTSHENPVLEYAAEVAVRYMREQSQALNGQRIVSPWKCVRPENALVWSAIAREFFGGRDLVPSCE